MDFSNLLLQVSWGLTAAILPDILVFVNLKSLVLLFIYTQSKLDTQIAKSVSTVRSYIPATKLIKLCSIFVDGTISPLSLHINLTAYEFRQAQVQKQGLLLLLPGSVSQGIALLRHRSELVPFTQRRHIAGGGETHFI
jgi:hypothetical protein